MTTRQEHMEWCKKRALEYVERGDGQNAIASMLSDLRKHEETERIVEGAFLLVMAINTNNLADVRRFIEGFA